MTPEWEELKQTIQDWAAGLPVNQVRETYHVVIREMEEIERRSLPVRVAKLLDGLNNDDFIKHAGWTTRRLAEITSKTLRTGDTSELERWQVKK